MVIHISDELMRAMESSQKACQFIKLLFVRFEQGKHKWHIENENLGFLKESDILKSFSEFIQKYCVESLAYSNAEPKHLVRLAFNHEIKKKEEELSGRSDVDIKNILDGNRVVAVYNETTHDFISIDLAESFLGGPLKIIIENIESDGLFIKTCLTYIGELNLSELWVEFLHGGGNDTIKVAQNIKGLERVVCLADSDKISPGVTNPGRAEFCKRLRKVCDEYGYILHILNKREMENYIPDEALKEYLTDTGRDCDSHNYFGLTDIQKDYFDLRNGLGKKDYENDIWKNICSKTYEEVSVTIDEKETSFCGFGDRVWKAFECVKNGQQLRERDGANELDQLVNKIVSFL